MMISAQLSARPTAGRLLFEDPTPTSSTDPKLFPIYSTAGCLRTIAFQHSTILGMSRHHPEQLFRPYYVYYEHICIHTVTRLHHIYLLSGRWTSLLRIHMHQYFTPPPGHYTTTRYCFTGARFHRTASLGSIILHTPLRLHTISSQHHIGKWTPFPISYYCVFNIIWVFPTQSRHSRRDTHLRALLLLSFLEEALTSDHTFITHDCWLWLSAGYHRIQG